MKRSTLLLSILLFLNIATLSPVKACTCDDTKPFLTVAPQAKLVALVRIMDYRNVHRGNPASMEVEIITVYKGKEKRKKIRIWGDNGMLCRPYINTFGLHKYYLIGLYNCSQSSNPDALEKPDHYFVSVCGSYWLNVNNTDKTVSGNIAKNQQKTTLSEIKSKL